MNAQAIVLLTVCVFLMLLVPFIVFLLTYIFRQACVLCGLPKPSLLTATGVMFLILVSSTLSEGLMDLAVIESCDLAGLPRWESGFIVFFLLLPIDLLISAGLHSVLMNIRFGKGIEVWFVQWLIRLSIISVIAFLVGVTVLVYQING